MKNSPRTQYYFIIFFLIFFHKIGSVEELRDVLIDSYNYYPDIKKGKSDLKVAKKDLEISRSDFLPSLDLTVSQGRKISKSNPDSSQHNFTNLNPTTVDLEVSQPLGATKFLNFKFAKNSFQISELKNKSLIQEILYKATKSYYTLLKDRFLLDVAIKNEKNLKQKYEATEKRFGFKDVTRTDVFQAQARLSEATSKKIEAENNYDIAISDFISIVGREPNINWFDNNKKDKITSSNPKDWSKFVQLPKLPRSLDESIRIALVNNPDFLQLKFEVKNAKIDIKKKGLNFAPEFSITGSYGKSLESSRTIERKDEYELTADFTVPIFNKGHNFYNVDKAISNASSSENIFQTKKITLKHEIRSSWKKIQSLMSSIQSLEKSVESNLVALDGVTKEFGVGTRTTIEILDAEKELTQAEANLINAQYDLVNSSYLLLKSCGLLNFKYLIIK